MKGWGTERRRRNGREKVERGRSRNSAEWRESAWFNSLWPSIYRHNRDCFTLHLPHPLSASYRCPVPSRIFADLRRNTKTMYYDLLLEQGDRETLTIVIIFIWFADVAIRWHFRFSFCKSKTIARSCQMQHLMTVHACAYSEYENVVSLFLFYQREIQCWRFHWFRRRSRMTRN